MLPKLLWLAIFAVLFVIGPVRSAPYFVEHKPYEALLIDTPASATTATTDEVLENTTTQYNIENHDSERFNSDEEPNVKIASASLDPAPGTVEDIQIPLDTMKEENYQNDEVEKRLEEEDKRLEGEEKQLEQQKEKELNEELEKELQVALNRDEDISLDIVPNDANAAKLLMKPAKSAKLLLLSTPRLNREQEENIEEPEELDVNTEVNNDTVTEMQNEMEQTTAKDDNKVANNNKEHNEDKVTIDDKANAGNKESNANNNKESDKGENEESFITRLKDTIFGTKTDSAKEASTEKPKEAQGNSNENNTKSNSDESNKTADENNDEPITVTATEQIVEPHIDNVASAVFVETEPDYVLVNTDVEHLEQLGSYTHADSEEHLQPIVHSVEVVPTHFHEPLLVSYVQTW